MEKPYLSPMTIGLRVTDVQKAYRFYSKLGFKPDIMPTYEFFTIEKCVITCEPMKEFWCEQLFTAIDPFGYEWQFTQGSKLPTSEDAQSAWGMVAA